MDCCSPSDAALDHQFDAKRAADDLREYRRHGPAGTTLALIAGLADGGVAGRTILEIGGGVGAVHHELLREGAASAVDVDASRAYLAIARAEAERQGHADRVDYVAGDFVAIAERVQPADLVALDRVICCYGDMVTLVGRSASLARRRYGLVYPRDGLLSRAAVGLLNLWQWITRNPYRGFVHDSHAVDALVARHGLVRVRHSTTLLWQVAIYERIVVAGRSIVNVRLTPAAYNHGLAIALPEAVMARPEGLEPPTL